MADAHPAAPQQQHLAASDVRRGSSGRSSTAPSSSDARVPSSSDDIEHAATSAVGLEGVLAPPAKAALEADMYPSDSYVRSSDGRYTYWADLPWHQKVSFTTSQSNEEARRELSSIWATFKRSPTKPMRSYFSQYVLTGMGLFVEGYVLFSVSNLTALFKLVWPECWKSHDVCDKEWISAVEYLEIIGIIVGQVIVGVEADWLGRRFGMIQDALIMTLGSLMLTAQWGTSLNGWVICYAWSLFVYGVGVGGEYPTTSTRAMEAMANETAGETARQDRLHRGRRVALSFLMQGWGQLLNQGVLILALLATNSGHINQPISKTATQWTFRFSFFFIIPPTLYLLYVRWFKMKDSDKALNAAKAKHKVEASGYDVKSLKLAMRFYWHRLVGTAGGWFVSDFLFYGSRLFSTVFIATVTGSSNNLQSTWLYNLLNVGVSLVGYYMGAFLVDHKLYGRKYMQFNGLLFLFVVFLLCAALYPQLTTPGNGIRAFMALYFLSSWAQQFGANTTTFLLAAEVFPASIRATAHGVSAATGKLGALAPAILYNYIDVRTRFWVVCWFGLVGAILTLVFVPDTTGLDLQEQERYWGCILSGRSYHGVAIHPRHLSLWERVVLKRHANYSPELDRQKRLEEDVLAEQHIEKSNPVAGGAHSTTSGSEVEHHSTGRKVAATTSKLEEIEAKLS